jgi:hypothetical protein
LKSHNRDATEVDLACQKNVGQILVSLHVPKGPHFIRSDLGTSHPILILNHEKGRKRAKAKMKK